MVFGGTSCSHISHSLVAATAVDLQLLFLGGKDCQQALETITAAIAHAGGPHGMEVTRKTEP